MFVWRNENGLVVGLFANAQPGYAEEYLAADHPDILDFYRPQAELIEAAKNS